MKILAVNPGSTSTKISVYENENKVFETTLRHSSEEIKKFNKILDQYEWRKQIIVETVEGEDIHIKDFNAIVGRGGLINPIESGTYAINDKMLNDLKEAKLGEHASNLGAFIAKSIADSVGIPSFIVDPVVVDEFEPIARISGLKNVERRSIFHALNQKAVARALARDLNKDYESISIIVLHMGGGISVGAHKNGRVIDVINALDGEGTFTPERSGGLPARDLIKLCYSGKYTPEQMLKQIIGEGGMVSYLGTNNLLYVCNMANSGDENAKLLVNAMCYQIAKDIGAMSTVLYGKVDAIAFTGGIANDKEIVENLKERVEYIAPIYVYPGEEEMFSLTQGCIRALKYPETIKEYK